LAITLRKTRIKLITLQMKKTIALRKTELEDYTKDYLFVMENKDYRHSSG
jgi:hypothetical protein